MCEAVCLVLYDARRRRGSGAGLLDEGFVHMLAVVTRAAVTERGFPSLDVALLSLTQTLLHGAVTSPGCVSSPVVETLNELANLLADRVKPDSFDFLDTAMHNHGYEWESQEWPDPGEVTLTDRPDFGKRVSMEVKQRIAQIPPEDDKDFASLDVVDRLNFEFRAAGISLRLPGE